MVRTSGAGTLSSTKRVRRRSAPVAVVGVAAMAVVEAAVAAAGIAAAAAVAEVATAVVIAETAATAGSFSLSFSSVSASGAHLRPKRILPVSRFLRILAGIALAYTPARCVSIIHSFGTFFWPSAFLQCTIAAFDLAASRLEVLPAKVSAFRYSAHRLIPVTETSRGVTCLIHQAKFFFRS